jgi:hypothetical protein
MREIASEFAGFHSLGRLNSEGHDRGHRRSPDNYRGIVRPSRFARRRVGPRRFALYETQLAYVNRRLRPSARAGTSRWG